MFIPTTIHRPLAIVQAFCPAAFVGGGALRDHDNGKPIKDIDIFIEPIPNLNDVIDTLGNAGWAIINTDIQATEDYGSIGLGVERLVELLPTVEGELYPINLIAVTEGTCSFEKQTARFDFGICQIAYDGRQVRATDAYNTDKAMKTFTLFAREGDREARSLRRWDRLQQKYADWRLVTA